MTTDLIAMTDDLLGIPYKLGGRTFTPDGGTDCLGICWYVVRECCGIAAEDPWPRLHDDYDRGGNPGMPVGWRTVTQAELQPGDIGVSRDGRQISCYLGEGWWITATAKVGVNRFSWRHRPRFDAFYRWAP